MALSTIALLVLFASVFIFFSEELRTSAKKIINNDKIRFFIVTFCISMLALEYEEYLDMWLLQLKAFILYLLSQFLRVFHSLRLWEIQLGEVLILIIIAWIPIFIGKMLSNISFIKKLSPNINNIFLHVAVYLWVISSLALFVKN